MLLLDSRRIVLLLPRSQIIPFITVQWQSRKRLLRRADCVRSRSSSSMERDVRRDALMVELYRPGRVLESIASTEREASLVYVIMLWKIMFGLCYMRVLGCLNPSIVVCSRFCCAPFWHESHRGREYWTYFKNLSHHVENCECRFT